MNYLIGHLVGDYILQNDWMAQNKKKSWFPCFVHCVLYTLAVMLFTGWNIVWAPAVFVSHYIFDRTGIVMWYMKITKKTIPDGQSMSDPKVMFFPLVYVGVDNTLHLVCLWLINKFIV